MPSLGHPNCLKPVVAILLKLFDAVACSGAVPVGWILCATMVVAQRISSLMEFAKAGRQIWISYSWSGVSGKLKAKVHIESADNVVPLHARPLMLQCLQPLKELQTEVVVDRGHCFSAGHAFANFWIEPAPDVGAFTGEGSSGTNTPLADVADLAPLGGDTIAVGRHAPSGLPLQHVTPPDLTGSLSPLSTKGSAPSCFRGIVDETAESHAIVEPSVRVVLKSCLKPPSMSCLEDVPVHVLHNMMMAAEDTLKSRKAAYDSLKANSLELDPTTLDLKLAIADEAANDANNVANAATERWHAAFLRADGADG